MLTQRKGKFPRFSEVEPLIHAVVFRYSLLDGASFAEQARGVAFDLAGDEALQDRKRRQLRWDKTKKKFVKGTGEGADNVKLVKTESGVKLPASYRSGRFDEWKAKSRTGIPRVGETEGQTSRRGSAGGRKWKHTQVVEAKPLDKLSKNYDRKLRQQKKREEEAPASSSTPGKGKGRSQKQTGGRFKGKTFGKIKSELKTVDQIRRARSVAENRRAKNARPAHRRGKR